MSRFRVVWVQDFLGFEIPETHNPSIPQKTLATTLRKGSNGTAGQEIVGEMALRGRL